MALRNPPLCLALAGLAILLAVARSQYSGPKPHSQHEPLEEFAAMRAVPVLDRILGDQSPHPTGSRNNTLVRRRLIQELEAIGLQAETQASIPGRSKRKPVVNVLARLPGESDALRPLVLATHYDSVSAGPGAADAGACVAALIECARALIRRGPTKRPVYLLFTDGEEAGLWGAREFVKRHPLSRRRPFVLNFDARGTSGASLMYETHAGNLSAVRRMAAHAPRPVFTASSFVGVYRRLPNDTDFSVFRKAGWPGLNFAFIGDAHRYHTARDTIEHLDLRSLQHHGQNALALSKHLAESDAALTHSSTDAVFFDLLGLFLVCYPATWSIPLAAAACIVLAVAVWRAGRLRCAFRGLALTAATAALVAVLSALLGFAASLALRACGILASSFSAYDGVVTGGYWAGVALITWVVARRVLRRVSTAAVWDAVWLLWSAAGLAAAFAVPELSYLPLIPAILAAALSWLRGDRRWLSAATALGAGLILAPTLYLLAMAFGAKQGAMLCWVFSLSLAPLYPLLAGRQQHATATAPEMS